MSSYSMYILQELCSSYCIVLRDENKYTHSGVAATGLEFSLLGTIVITLASVTWACHNNVRNQDFFLFFFVSSSVSVLEME